MLENSNILQIITSPSFGRCLVGVNGLTGVLRGAQVDHALVRAHEVQRPVVRLEGERAPAVCVQHSAAVFICIWVLY